MKVEDINIEELRHQISGLQIQKDSIKQQIDEARRNAAAEKIFADRQWLLRAEAAFRTKGRQIGDLQIELSRKIKSEKANRNESFERVFMLLCKEKYPDVYEELFVITERTVRT